VAWCSGSPTVLVGYANGALLMRGPDVIGVQSTGMAAWAVVLVTIGVLAIIGGAIGQFVAWIGAVRSTAQRNDKTGFLILLLLGVLSFGFLAMLMYVVAGRDGAASSPKQRGIGLSSASPRASRARERRDQIYLPQMRWRHLGNRRARRTSLRVSHWPPAVARRGCWLNTAPDACGGEALPTNGQMAGR